MWEAIHWIMTLDKSPMEGRTNQNKVYGPPGSHMLDQFPRVKEI